MGDQRVAQPKTLTSDRTFSAAIALKSMPASPTAAHPLLKLQRQIGNRAVAHQIQAKMTVGKPNDTYEQEADRVAHTVMRMPDPPLQRAPEEKKDEQAQPFSLQRQPNEKKDEQAQAKLAIGKITPLVQRATEEKKDEQAQMLQLAPEEKKDEQAQMLQLAPEEKKDEQAQMLQLAPEEKKDEQAQMLQLAPEEKKDEHAQMLQLATEEKKEEQAQAKANSQAVPEVATPVETRIHSMRGGGKSLPEDTRGFFESRMGYDFSGVRIHADSQAGEVAGSLNAQAFAIGRDVFFNTGRYEPHTSQGKWLLAHELTHTVQQNPATPRSVQRQAMPTLSLSPQGVIRRKMAGGKAPSSPAQDPAFQAVVKKAKTAAKKQKQHDPAKAKAAASQAAAVPPANDVGSKAAGKQVGQMDQQQPKPFDRKAFKAALLAKISAAAPKNLKEADEFKESGKVGAIKGDLTQQVDSNKKQSGGAIETKVKGTPDPSGIPAKSVSSLPPNPVGAPPGNIDAKQSAPKPKAAAEVSLQAGSQSLDQQMADADVTEDQLKKSNEPDFQGAVDAKQEAQKDAVTAPQEYRQGEQAVLAQAQSQAVTTAKTQLTGMHGVRGQAQNKTTTAQQQAKAQDEQKRVAVANELQTIYTQTKKAAEDRLARLDTEVNQAFDQGATAAQQNFEDYVQRRMDAYKDDRYSGIIGRGRWVKDKFFGMPSEVNAFYQEGRQLYIAQMDAVLDRVSILVEKGLNEAKAEIAKGRKAIEKKLGEQDPSLRKALQEDAQKIQGQFDQLEQSVDDKQNQLIDSLAQKYNEKLQAIDARIDEMKAANRGLVDKAIDAVGGVIKAILQLKDLLLNVLAKVASAIKKIIKNPIGFLGNLVAGVKQGFMNFIGNIGTHLQEGLIGWLFGALAEAGIELPKSFDLKGILSLVLQVLGATWTFIRARAVKILGEKVVSAMETTAEIFQILMTQGIAGVWEYIKEQVSHLKDVVIDGIKSFVTESIIKAGVTWILGLLNPAGAFIKACKAIYDIVMFFVERGSQIIALVNAVVDSVGAIADGAIDVAASKVENALAKAIPVVISFLAALLGVTGITEKIRAVIAKVQAPVGKAIDWLINKAYNLVKAAGKLLGFGKGKDEEKEKAKDQERLNQGLLAAQAAVNRFSGKRVGSLVLKPLLATIKLRYRMRSLEVIPRGQNWVVRGIVNPEGELRTDAQTTEEGPSGSIVVGETVTFDAGEQHRLWIDTTGARAVVQVASRPEPLTDKLRPLRAHLDKLTPENRGNATSLMNTAETQGKALMALADTVVAAHKNNSPTIAQDNRNLVSQEHAVIGTLRQLYALYRDVHERDVQRITGYPDAGLIVPQGITDEQWAQIQTIVIPAASQYSDDVRVQGSRAAGRARPDSDMDFAIRVTPERFLEIARQRFGANPGSSKTETMQHALTVGKIQTGEIGLRGIATQVKNIAGLSKRPDISVIRIGGLFDNGPWVRL